MKKGWIMLLLIAITVAAFIFVYLSENRIASQETEPQTIKEEPISSSQPETEETEDNLKTLTLNKKTYGDEDEFIDMSFSIDGEGKYHYGVNCIIKESWKAAYAFTLYTAIASEIQDEGISPMIIVSCDGVMLSSAGICFDTSNGETEIIDSSDWCAKQLIGTDSKQREKFSDKLNEYWEDFWDETIEKIK